MDRILIVDDERGVRESLQAVLTDEGFEADAVSTGEECLELLAERVYGAVLLDVWLPRKDGLEVLETMAADPQRPAVIIISGHGSIDAAVRATKMGAFDFLEKPLSLEKTVLVVRNALRQQRLTEQNRRLRRELEGEARLIGRSPAIAELRALVARHGPEASPVLIRGEGGAGKEVVARALHAAGPRSEEPFVVVRCAALPEEEFVGELFGRSQGGRGRVDEADGGTLFLDDVSEMPAEAQGRLERLLAEGVFEPEDGGEPRRADVRVIASTGLDLRPAVREGAFRADLEKRLRGTSLLLPPLRERLEDIAPLAEHFLAVLRRHYGNVPREIEEEALEALRAHPWPGNVRELRNLVEWLAITAPGERVGRADLPPSLGGASTEEDPFAPQHTLREGRELFERQFIRRRLAENDYNVTRTAKSLGLERSHLHRKIKALGLD